MKQTQTNLRATKRMFSWRLEATIPTTHRGVLYRDGVPVEWLNPGRHQRSSGRDDLELRFISVERPFQSYDPDLVDVLPETAAIVLDLKPGQMAVVTVDGQPRSALEPGRYLLWQLRHHVEGWVFDTDEIHVEMSEPFARLFPKSSLTTHYVSDEERGLVYVDGTLTSWLEPGRHRMWSKDRKLNIETVLLSELYIKPTPELERIIPDKAYELVEIPRHHIAIVTRDGTTRCATEPGRYMLWRRGEKDLQVELFDVRPAQTDIPQNYWELIPEHHLRQVVVHPYERCLLYVDGELHSILEQGWYGLHPTNHLIETTMVDLREQELQITGQEVMTADKVTIRVNVIAKYRVTDPVLSVEAQVALRDAMYSEVQLAARRTIGACGLENLLEDRDRARATMMEDLAGRATAWGVEIVQADLKDMILPGEMKSLLNRVIEAQKQAEANVILRREQTASTRAQANAAKMMETNHALMRLKELETLKDIATTIDSLTVVVRGDEVVQGLMSSDRAVDHSGAR